MNNNKKQIRVYINLDNPIERKIYKLLEGEKSPSNFIKAVLFEEINRIEDNNIIAAKLDLIVNAINNINIVAAAAPGESECIPYIDFDLKKDNFDDDY